MSDNTDNTELSFISCFACGSLVPAVSTRCRMCGAVLEATTPSENLESNIENSITNEEVAAKEDVTSADDWDALNDFLDKAKNEGEATVEQEAKIEKSNSLNNFIENEDDLVDDKSLEDMMTELNSDQENLEEELDFNTEQVDQVQEVEEILAEQDPETNVIIENGAYDGSTKSKLSFGKNNNSNEDLDASENFKLESENEIQNKNEQLNALDEQDDIDQELLKLEKELNESEMDFEEDFELTDDDSFVFQEDAQETEDTQEAEVVKNDNLDSELNRIIEENSSQDLQILDDNLELEEVDNTLAVSNVKESKTDSTNLEMENNMELGEDSNNVSFVDQQSDDKLVGWFISYNDPKGHALELREGRFFISGTNINNSVIVLEDESVSTPHALISVSATNGVFAQDLISKGGVYLKRVGEGSFQLQEFNFQVKTGDWIKFGNVEFLFVQIPNGNKE